MSVEWRSGLRHCISVPYRPYNPQKILQLHHREHPDGLRHCLVWQLLGLRPQGTTEGSAYGPVHHRGQASCHPGPLYQAVSEEGTINWQSLQTPYSLTVLPATERQAEPT